MNSIFRKIEIEISKISDFKYPKLKLEQYSTSSNVIKEFLIFLEEDLYKLLENKKNKEEIVRIADYCAGTGYLGISIILFYYFLLIENKDHNLFSKLEFTFVEKDKEAFHILNENLEIIKNKYYGINNVKIKTINEDIFYYKPSYKFDLIVMNPPFGIQGKVKDIEFLNKALKDSSYVVSFHLSGSLDFLLKKYPIKDFIKTYIKINPLFWFHTKPKKEIEIIICKIKN